YPTEAISGADHEGMVDVDATSYMKIFLSKHWVQAAYFLGPKTIRESLLDTPLSPLVAIEYVLSKQEQPLLGSEKKGAPIIKVLKAVSNQISTDEIKKTVHVLLDVCNNTGNRFKRIIDALEQDDPDIKMIKQYSLDGAHY
ncbi:hypothetical protein F4703DRAFT_1707320, partial [Phycomyces blakesleeanus]